ncbi:MAG: iron-sulfur cluster repair di-iron protein [Phycisphaeraceae bacterium]
MTLAITTAPITTESQVGQLVAERPSRSRVFQGLGIDFCCGGKLSLAAACQKKGLDAQTVVRMLQVNEDQAGGSAEVDAAAMTMTELCNHIETTHHAYLRSELPRLHQMLSKIAAVHGDHYPWTREVLAAFDPMMQEMGQHMMKEEQILFPLIRQLDAGQACGTSHCGSIANPIRMMEYEHDNAGAALAKFRQLTSDYTPPADACNTFRAALDGLAQLEADMHQHVHKENNVLFPRALAREVQ